MRDKLAKLIFDCWLDTTSDANGSAPTAGQYADYLIAHGVTIATDNNVACKYCAEDKDGYGAMFGVFSLCNPYHGSEWLIQTGPFRPSQIYFCPMCGRKLSEPPKGE